MRRTCRELHASYAQSILLFLWLLYYWLRWKPLEVSHLFLCFEHQKDVAYDPIRQSRNVRPRAEQFIWFSVKDRRKRINMIKYSYCSKWKYKAKMTVEHCHAHCMILYVCNISIIIWIFLKERPVLSIFFYSYSKNQWSICIIIYIHLYSDYIYIYVYIWNAWSKTDKTFPSVWKFHCVIFSQYDGVSFSHIQKRMLSVLLQGCHISI